MFAAPEPIQLNGPIDAETFDEFCRFIYEKSGITLRKGKESLVQARMARRMRATGITSYRNYLEHVRRDSSGRELVHMLDAISTNLTFFFREEDHFDFLSTILKEWKAKGQLRYRLWCAAASTGEEPYSIAMTTCESLGESRSDTRILATDISTQVLAKCRAGEYDAHRLEKVPPRLRDKYFKRADDVQPPIYRVKSDLRAMLAFKRLNLATPPFPMRGPLDIIFCRNVMIYFDDAVRQRLIREVERLLKPGGYFIIAHCETLARIQHSFKTIRPSVFMKVK